MITIKSFIADLESELSAYTSAGLIDEISIYKWITKACLKFGANIMTLQDTVIEVENSQGSIPDHFFSLYAAYICDRKGYVIEEEDRKVLQKSYSWVERVEKSNKWNTCEPCCKEEEEKTIIENHYFGDIEAQFHYDNPILLRLGKTFDRNKCHKECRNKVVRDNKNEIIINENTLFTNFKSGDVYMQFYGLPVDERGVPLIPNSPKGEVETYLEYHVKRKVFENVIANNDDERALTMFKYYVQKEDSQLGLALTDAKFSKLTPKSFNRLKLINRREMYKYENLFPKI